MHRAALTALLAVAVLAIGAPVVGYFVLRDTGPSSGEKAACAYLQDAQDDSTGQRGNAAITAWWHAGDAANRSGNDELAAGIRRLRAKVAVSQNDTSSTRKKKAAIAAIQGAWDVCKKIGIQLHS